MKTIKVLIELFSISFFLLFCTGIVGQNNIVKTKNDLTELKLKGKIKSLSETTFKAIDKFGIIQKGDMIFPYKSFTLFNVKGNEIEKDGYNILYGNGKQTYKCDDDGNHIEWNTYNSDGILVQKYTYKIDNKGNVIEGNCYKPDGSFSRKYSNKYDDKGNNIEENHYGPDGSLYGKVTYKYNDKGNNIEQNWYMSDGSLTEKLIYKYDNMGNNIEEYSYKSDGSLNKKQTYKYDNKGNKIEFNLYNTEGSLDNTSIFTFNYNYDINGNWIKKTEFINGIPQKIIEREIKYY